MTLIWHLIQRNLFHIVPYIILGSYQFTLKNIQNEENKSKSSKYTGNLYTGNLYTGNIQVIYNNTQQRGIDHYYLRMKGSRCKHSGLAAAEGPVAKKMNRE